MSLKSVRWKESLTSSSKMDTTENCFASHSSKKSSAPDSPALRCKSSEKATAKGFGVGAKTPSDVNGCGPSGICHHIAAIVCKCAWLCSLIAWHLLTLQIAVSASAGDTIHLWRSWTAFVALRRSVDICLSLGECTQVPADLLSVRFSSPGDAAYASRPDIDARTIRDKKFSRLWLRGERANHKRRNANQSAAIACRLHSISAVLLPLKAYLPPKCLALYEGFACTDPLPACCRVMLRCSG